MTEAGSPFGGGYGGHGTGVNAPVPQDLMDLFNAATKRKYIVDPVGARVEMTFDFSSTTVTIKAGDSVLVYPFIKA